MGHTHHLAVLYDLWGEAQMIPLFPQLTAEEAAALIKHGQMVAFGGFTVAGTPLAIGAALAAHAHAEHAAGREFGIGNIGVATSPTMDGLLAGAVSFRTP